VPEATRGGGATLRALRVRSVWKSSMEGTFSEVPLSGFEEIVSDSGHPSFLTVDGEMVLAPTLTYAGYGGGPYYSSMLLQPELQNGINALGSCE